MVNVGPQRGPGTVRCRHAGVVPAGEDTRVAPPRAAPAGGRGPGARARRRPANHRGAAAVGDGRWRLAPRGSSAMTTMASGDFDVLRRLMGRLDLAAPNREEGGENGTTTLRTTPDQDCIRCWCPAWRGRGGRERA